MKNLWKGFMLLFVCFLLVACNKGATQTNEDPSENEGIGQEEKQKDKKEGKKSSSENEKNEKNVQDFMNKVMDATQEMKSYTLEMTLEHEFSDTSGEVAKTTAKTTMDIVTDPLGFYQKMEMKIIANDQEQTTVTEAYYTEDGFYMSSPFSGQWLKMPGEMMEKNIDVNAFQTNPFSQVELISNYIDLISIEEDPSHYILRIKGKDKSFERLIRAFGQSNPEENPRNSFVEMNIQSFDFAFYYDKANYFPIKSELSAVFVIDSDDSSTTIKQFSTGTYSNINQFDKINIPDHVKNNFVEF